MCAVKTEDDCFRYTDVMCAQYRRWYRSILSDTDTEWIPAVSADTEYPMPVSVSPYPQLNSNFKYELLQLCIEFSHDNEHRNCHNL